MAITEVNVTSAAGSSVDATTFTTVSASPGANRLLIFAAIANFASAAPEISLSGGPSVTWEELLSVITLSSGRRLKVWAALAGASPGSGGITISSGGTTMTGCLWVMRSFIGTYLGGSALDSIYGFGSNSVSSGTTVQAAPGALEAAGDGTFSIFSMASNATITTEQTEIADIGHATPAQRMGMQWTAGDDADGPLFTIASPQLLEAYSWHLRDAANPPPVTFSPSLVTVQV